MRAAPIWMLFLLALLAAPAAGEEAAPTRKKVAGTRVSVLVPSGFTKAANFAGYERREGLASIAATELPHPAAKVIPGLTDRAWKTKGVTVKSREDVTVDGRKGILIHGAQSAEGAEFRKWIAVFGDGDGTVIVMGTFLAAAKEELSTKLRTSVLSARWRTDLEANPFEGLDFRVKPPAALRLANRMGQMLSYTRDGEAVKPDPREPLFIVGPSLGGGKIADLGAFAKERVRKTATCTDIEIATGRAVEIGGLAGYEIVADAKHDKTRVGLVVYQVVLAREDSGYYIMQGLVGADRRDAWLAVFRKTARSFEIQ